MQTPPPPLAINLNANMGEGCPNDEALIPLIPLISSASIACGADVGDAHTMATTSAGTETPAWLADPVQVLD